MTGEDASDRRVVVGGLVIDLDAERVADAAGRPCALRPQTFAVLRHLVENPGRLVTKDELMQAVWPGVAVTDDSLVQCIGEYLGGRSAKRARGWSRPCRGAATGWRRGPDRRQACRRGAGGAARWSPASPARW